MANKAQSVARTITMQETAIRNLRAEVEKLREALGAARGMLRGHVLEGKATCDSCAALAILDAALTDDDLARTVATTDTDGG